MQLSKNCNDWSLVGILDRILKKKAGEVLADFAQDLFGQEDSSQGTVRGPADGNWPAPDGSDPTWSSDTPSTGWLNTDQGAGQAGAGQGETNQKSVNYYRTHKSTVKLKDHAWFANMLSENFTDYTIRESVEVSELEGEGRPYTFMMIKDGYARAAIMLTPHNKYNNRAFKGAKAACEAKGVPFVNFFLHLDNEPDYVINRIRNSLI